MAAAKFKIESGAQLLARLVKKPDLENFYPTIFQKGLRNGEVIEVVYSENNCSPHFIHEIVSEVLIQSRLKGVPAGVLFFKTDGLSSYRDIFDVIKKKLSILGSYVNPEELDKDFQDLIFNFHAVDVFDVTKYYTTIHNLESILMENSNIVLIVFDTLTAFYWSEQGNKLTRMDTYIKNLLNLIQKVTKEYKIICLYTRPEYFCTNKDNVSIADEINFQIHLINYIKGTYQVNVKASSFQATMYYKIVNKQLKWIQDEKC